jgi:hypothetical protein
MVEIKKDAFDIGFDFENIDRREDEYDCYEAQDFANKYAEKNGYCSTDEY